VSHPGWACLGGTQLWNNEQTATYARNGWSPSTFKVKGCLSCGPDIAKALDAPGGQYNNPGTDEAPWFAETEPDSYDFGGLLVTSVTGLGAGTYTRSTTPRASGRGSFLGPGQHTSPEIVVRGMLLGRTCCSVDYGMRWLNQTLRGACGDGCSGDDLTFLECCPDMCEDDEAFESYEDCLAPYLRTLKGVAVTKSPVIVDRIGSSCGCGSCPVQMVEFTLSASEPCVFREPVLVQSGVMFDPGTESPCPEWVTVPAGWDCSGPDCEPATSCVSDRCPPPPKPPTPPAAINPCVCDPMTTVRACINMPGDLIPEYAEGVPVVEIDSGSTELNQVRIRFWANPLLLPVEELDPCDACGEVTLSHIPAAAVFSMDGTTGKVTITCPGSEPTDAATLLGSRGGRLPFRFPEIPCGGVAYTMCVETETESVSTASVSLSLAVREC
jgi:hypothetical protein